jgi:hypothetical protein
MPCGQRVLSIDETRPTLQGGVLCSSPQKGLAAAAVLKPTVAWYTQYFRHLWVGVLAKETGPHGEALRHPVDGRVLQRS